MPDYRLCFLNESGEPDAVREFSAANDEEARLLSEDALSGQAAQLWRQQELVARFQPD
jgi:hypothetical protein